jgi:hypothetical protein
MIRYSIHGYVDVFVDDTISKNILSALETQIGYFRDKNYSNSNSSVGIINIRPLSMFIKIENAGMEVNGSIHQYYNDTLIFKKENLAVLRTKNGFDIYANNSSFLINFYIQMLTIENDLCLVHAAAIKDSNDNVILLPAFGGAGKTAIVGEMVKNHDYKLLGDDLVFISSDKNCLSLPRSFVLKEYHRNTYKEMFNSLNISAKRHKILGAFKGFVKDNAPFKGLLKAIAEKRGVRDSIADTISPKDYLAVVPVLDMFGIDNVVDVGKIDKIIYLQRYSGSKYALLDLPKDEVQKRMFAIINLEWVEYFRQMLVMGGFGMINFNNYFSKVHDIISSSVDIDNSPKIMLIPEKSSIEQLINYFKECIK